MRLCPNEAVALLPGELLGNSKAKASRHFFAPTLYLLLGQQCILCLFVWGHRRSLLLFNLKDRRCVKTVLDSHCPAPLPSGSTVQTKHGNVNTDHILFVCSGAFHSVKPADMLAELQVRDAVFLVGLSMLLCCSLFLFCPKFSLSLWFQLLRQPTCACCRAACLSEWSSRV